MSRIDMAYLAGIIDGEGCVYVNRRNPAGRRRTHGYGVKVVVSTTSKSLVEWLKRRARLTSIFYVEHPGPNRKPKWVCTWNNSAAEWLLTSVLGFLVIKRDQSLLGLKLLKHLRTTPVRRTRAGVVAPVSKSDLKYREGIKQKIAALNKRGI